MKQKKSNSLFYERIKEQAKLRGQSLNNVERNLGYPRNALNNYKHARNPSANRILDLAQYFGVPPEYLIGEADSSPSIVISPAVYFDQLTDKEKRQIFIISQTWVLETFQKILLKSKDNCC